MKFYHALLTIVLLGLINYLAASYELPYFLTPEKIVPADKHTSLCRIPNLQTRAIFSEKESAIIQEPYDVLNYNLFMDWSDVLSKPALVKIDTLTRLDTIFNPDGSINEIRERKVYDSTITLDRKWTGTNEITIRIDSANTTEVSFDVMGLQILNVKVDNVDIIPTPFAESGKLKIQIGTNRKPGDVLKIAINYKYVYDFDWGFWLYDKGKYDYPWGASDYLEERLAYTMSEPQEARYWMPCNDAPYDKAMAAITVRVPKGFSVASNGLLKDIKDDGNTSTFYWEETSPLTTYLMVAVASKFKVFSDWYKKVTNPNDSVEIKYFVWQKDYDGTKTDGSEFNARYSFRNVAQQMKVYSEVYGEYPFSKYGMVSIQPFIFGGMEHQTMTSINRSWLYGWSDWGIAHELAHQWIGDLITCATWNDVWINEGGATWSEAIWTESLAGMEGYYSSMNGTKSRYLSSEALYDYPIYGISVDRIFGSHATLVYQKASWIYHMLRCWLGDEVYFKAFRNMLNKFANKSLESRDFQKSFEDDVKDPIVPFDIFFDQWVYHGGHPIYDLQTTASSVYNEGYDVTVNLKQTQSGTTIPDTFIAPLGFIFFGKEKNDTLIVLNDKREQSFHFKLSYIPDSVSIDTRKVLCDLLGSIVSVNETNSGENISTDVIPNPVIRGNDAAVRLNIVDAEPLNIDLFDQLGSFVKRIYSGRLAAGTYNFNFRSDDLSNGVYYIHCKYGDKFQTLKLSVIK